MQWEAPLLLHPPVVYLCLPRLGGARLLRPERRPGQLHRRLLLNQRAPILEVPLLLLHLPLRPRGQVRLGEGQLCPWACHACEARASLLPSVLASALP